VLSHAITPASAANSNPGCGNNIAPRLYYVTPSQDVGGILARREALFGDPASG
jgi:hypothetical protein